MNVFLSWSGDRGRLLAEALRVWLPDVLQNITPWVSSEDIDPGLRWSAEIAHQLQETRFGIICITPESIRAPWLLFESGALAKTVASAHVCPYLFEVASNELRDPLAQFDAVCTDEQGTLKLVRSLNRALNPESRLSDERVRRYFEKWWPELRQKLAEIKGSAPPPEVTVVGVEKTGLRQVCVNRTDALASFAGVLRSEAEKAQREQPCSVRTAFVYIAGTSLRGFLATAAGDFNGRQVLSDLVKSGCELRILLTEPEVGERRRDQEGRPLGAIANDIRKCIDDLSSLGLRPEQLRYCNGGPTVFGIATSEMMLLNPYPNRMEAQHGFSIIVAKVLSDCSIYSKYLGPHFAQPWDRAKPVDGGSPASGERS